MEEIFDEKRKLCFMLSKSNQIAQITTSIQASNDLVIPRSINYQGTDYLITSIKKGSFQNNSNIKSIKFSEDSKLHLIEQKSFYKSSINSLFIPANVDNLEEGWCSQTQYLNEILISPKNPNFKYLDEDHQIIVRKSDTNSNNYDTIVFANRNIKRANIPKTIKHIDSCAFENCEKLKSIEFLEDSELLTIGSNAFSNTSIKSLFIPANVKELKDGWNNKTLKLKRVTISPHNKHIKFLDNEHQIIVTKSDINTENFDKIIYGQKYIKSVKIPNSIKHIASYSFYNCYLLKKVDISEDSELRTIGKCAFYNCKIKKFFISSKVECLEESWLKCTNDLKKLLVSPKNEHFKYLDEEHQIIVRKSDINSNNYDTIVFANRDIECITIPKTIKHIDLYALYRCDNLILFQFSKDSEIETIQKKSFFSSSINKLFIPASVKELKEGWCCETPHLKEVIISPKNQHYKYLDEKHQIIVGKSDTNIENYDTIIFASRNITNCIIPKTIKYIDSFAFEHCGKLKSIEFSKDSELLKIGECAFSLTKISKLTIPASVVQLYNMAFFGCPKLEEVEFEKSSKILSFTNHLFSNCFELKTIIIPEDSKLYLIGRNVFDSTSIEKLFIPASVEKLEEGWLNRVSNLNEVIISESNQNFKYLDDSHEIIVKKSDTNKEDYDTIIFANRLIKHATIPKTIKRIDSDAFANCVEIDYIEFCEDSQLQTIGVAAFSNSSIKEIKIPKSVYSISNNAFSECFNLLNVKLEKGSKLRSLNKCLFDECEVLSSVIIPEDCNLQSIKEYVFRNCPIMSLYIPKSVVEIKNKYENLSPINDLKISPNNKHFKFLDEDHKIVVTKSDTNKEDFDTIISINDNVVHAKIPKSIKFIDPYASSFNTSIKSIEIDENSGIQDISFINFLIQNPIFESIQLNKGDQVLKNQRFKYLDDEHQIIVIKSDVNSDNFDTIIFADRKMKNAIIPKTVKYIGDNAFCNCKLNSIEFSEGSELQTIGLYTFNYSNIQSITIPKTVLMIEQSSFSNCSNLQEIKFEQGSKLQVLKRFLFSNCNQLATITIPEDSSLKKIETSIFENTLIESLFIPSKVEVIKQNWCFDNPNLKQVLISPENKCFKYLDDEHQIVVTKSDIYSDNFDSIIFACRNIKKALIHKSIKYIHPFAFQDCKQLKTVEIDGNSRLLKIGRKAFSSSSIVCFFIPKNVYNIDEVFDFSNNLKFVEFQADFIGKINIGNCQNLKIISFPNVKNLDFKLNVEFGSFPYESTVFVNSS